MATIIPQSQATRASLPGAQIRTIDPTDALTQGSKNLAAVVDAASPLVKQHIEKKNLDAVYRAQTSLGKILSDKQFEYSQLRGIDTDGLRKDSQAFFQQEYSRHLSELENPQQKQAFQQWADKQGIAFSDSAGSREIQQMTVALDASSKAKMKTTMDAAIAAYDNPELRQEHLGEMIRTINATATAQGQAPEMREATLREALTMTHNGVINQMLAQDQHDQAAEYFKQNKDTIDGSKKAEIKERIEKIGLISKSQKAADDILSKHSDRASALAAARKHDGELRDKIVSRINQRFNEKEAIDTEAQKAASNEFAEMIDNNPGMSYDDIVQARPELEGKLTLQSRSALRKYVEQRGRPERSDRVVYHELNQLALSNDPADIRKFKNLNLIDYSPDLSDEDWKKFSTLQAKPSDSHEYKGVQTKTQMMKQAMSEAGLKPKNLTEKGLDGEKARAFSDRFDYEVELETIAKGRDLAPSEIRAIGNRLKTEVITHKGVLWDTTEPVGSIQIPGVPDHMLDNIAEYLFATGQDLTTDNMKSLWNQGNYQAVYEAYIANGINPTPEQIAEGVEALNTITRSDVPR